MEPKAHLKSNAMRSYLDLGHHLLVPEVRCCSFIVINTLCESKPEAIAKGAGVSLLFERSNSMK